MSSVPPGHFKVWFTVPTIINEPCFLRRKIACLLWIAGLTLVSCTASRKPFDPGKKYSPEALRSDYRIFRGILQSAHPSLYWYTTKDSMNYFFKNGNK